MRPWLIGTTMLLAPQLASAQVGHMGSRGQQEPRVKPPVEAAADTVVPPPESKGGCSTFDVQLTGSFAVTVTRVPTANCGAITPALAGVPTFDSARRVVELPIALYNGGTNRLHAPAFIAARLGSLTATAGAPVRSEGPRGGMPDSARASAPTHTAQSASVTGSTARAPEVKSDTAGAHPKPAASAPGGVVLVGGSSPLASVPETPAPPPEHATGAAPPPVSGPAPQFVGGDPQRDSVGREPILAGWTFDTLLHAPNGPFVTASDGATVLPPNATSAPRKIDIHVPEGITAFRVTLVGIGTYVFTVPGRAPDRVPIDELRDSRASDNLIVGDPRFPGSAVRNKLWVLFRGDATIEQRQAALDAIDGIVVGGTVRGKGNQYTPAHGVALEHYYYVRFPANPDSGAAPLAHALKTLAPLPQVQDVLPDLITPEH